MFIAFDYATNFYLEFSLIYWLFELLRSSRHLISLTNFRQYKLAIFRPLWVYKWSVLDSFNWQEWFHMPTFKAVLYANRQLKFDGCDIIMTKAIVSR